MIRLNWAICSETAQAITLLLILLALIRHILYSNTSLAVLLITFSYLVCVSALTKTCVQYLNLSYKWCIISCLDRLLSYLVELIHPLVTKESYSKTCIYLQRDSVESCVCATEIFRTATVTRDMNLWVYCKNRVDVSQTWAMHLRVGATWPCCVHIICYSTHCLNSTNYKNLSLVPLQQNLPPSSEQSLLHSVYVKACSWTSSILHNSSSHKTLLLSQTLFLLQPHEEAKQEWNTWCRSNPCHVQQAHRRRLTRASAQPGLKASFTEPLAPNAGHVSLKPHSGGVGGGGALAGECVFVDKCVWSD